MFQDEDLDAFVKIYKRCRKHDDLGIGEPASCKKCYAG
jgi:hypothetical protein